MRFTKRDRPGLAKLNSTVSRTTCVALLIAAAGFNRKPLQQCFRRHGKIALGEQQRIGAGSLRRGLREPLERRRVSDAVDQATTARTRRTR